MVFLRFSYKLLAVAGAACFYIPECGRIYQCMVNSSCLYRLILGWMCVDFRTDLLKALLLL